MAVPQRAARLLVGLMPGLATKIDLWNEKNENTSAESGKIVDWGQGAGPFVTRGRTVDRS